MGRRLPAGSYVPHPGRWYHKQRIQCPRCGWNTTRSYRPYEERTEAAQAVMHQEPWGRCNECGAIMVIPLRPLLRMRGSAHVE